MALPRRPRPPRLTIGAMLCLVLTAGLVVAALRAPAALTVLPPLFAPAALILLGLIPPALGHHRGRRHARLLLADDRRARRRLGAAAPPESIADRAGRAAGAVAWGVLIWGLPLLAGAAALGAAWWMIVAAGAIPG